MSSSTPPKRTVSRISSIDQNNHRPQVRKPLPDPPSEAQQSGENHSLRDGRGDSIGRHVLTNARSISNPSDSNISLSETRTRSPSEKDQEHLPKNIPNKPGPRSGRIWLWEMTACAFSLLCMGAVIVVLIYEDGKTLDQWNFQITPNVVVSFIIALTKSAFLMVVAEVIGQLKWLHFHSKAQRLSDLKIFDEASRGPLGSLKLLFARHRHTMIASCAASIMLLALFVDPFVQLLLSFPSKSTLTPKEALFQTSMLYDPSGQRLDAHFTATRASSVDTTMQAAVIESLYNGSSPLRITCQTGNCTWGAVSTLGVCGGCEDVTARVEKKHAGGVESNKDATDYIFSWDPLKPNTTLRAWQNFIGATGQIRQTLWNSSAEVHGGKRGWWLQNLKATLVSTQSIQLPLGDSSSDGAPPARAFTCELNLCVKTYPQVSVTNGIGSLPVPKEEALLVNTSSSGASCAPAPDCGPQNINSLIFDALAQNTNFLEQYRINSVDYESMSNYFSEMLSTGFYNVGLSTRPAPPNGDDPTAPNTSPDIGRELAYSDDLDKTFKTMAESMTQAIRTARNSTSQIGKVYTHKTVIEIQWAWLAYPLVLMLLAIALLLFVIFQTRRQNIPAWKSSSLALLFHNLEGCDSPCRAVRTRKELDKVAKQMRVRFTESANHASFVKED